MKEIKYYCEDDKIVLWWEKPKAAAPDWYYIIKLDGLICGKTAKTHFTIDNLECSKEYMVEVCCEDTELFSSHITVCTTTPRQRIDVSAAPYFALGDGATINTKALQRAINDCPEGGSVYIPAGTYVTGALRLHSHMELYIEEGAVLRGSANPEDYLPRIHSRYEGKELECYQSLLNMGELDHTSGPNCEDIVIRGKGAILGGGYDLTWAIIESERERLRGGLLEKEACTASGEDIENAPHRVRGRLINMSNCKNIRINGLTLGEGASWNVHMIYSDHIITDHCTFTSKGIWNGDGWDPDSSTNCTLFACDFYTEDDSVAIKSGKNPEGNMINRPTKHIRVFDCYSAYGHGICMGSEMSGGIEDVKIWDCDLKNSTFGVEIKGTKKRGGYVRNVEVTDCIVPCLAVHSVSYNDDGIGAKEPPVFENFRYERVHITGRRLHAGQWQEWPPIELRGFDEDAHAVRNVVFKDVTIAGKEKIQMEFCKNIIGIQ